MSVIRTFTTLFRHSRTHKGGQTLDANDIRPFHDTIDIRRLDDVPNAARTIVEHALRRGYDDRAPNRVSVMIFAPLDRRQWFDLTSAVAMQCPEHMKLMTPSYSMLCSNGHQQFVFERLERQRRSIKPQGRLNARTST